MSQPTDPQPDTAAFLPPALSVTHAGAGGPNPAETATDAPAATSPAEAVAFGPPAGPNEVGTLGPYRIVRQIGRGGMGAVYLAVDTRLNRKLALKVMLPRFAADPAARERFLREARAGAGVQHDHVVTVYEADEREGVPYIAMQFLDGSPLDEHLRQMGTPPLTQVLRLAREAAAGLAAAHRTGLIHRDIKPANLWLEAPDGRVKLLDFGLARPVDAEVELTRSGAVMGTPAYMSPEQARGRKVDHRTDLFSLGVVLYLLCTGKLPFDGPTTMAVLMALGTEEPTPVRGLNPAIPEGLAALVHQLLAKDPAARPQTADDVVLQVRAIEAETGSGGGSSGSQPQVVYVPVPTTVLPPANLLESIDAPDARTVAQPTAGRKPSRRRLVGLGLVGLLAVIPGGVIIIKNKDGTETRIERPDDAPVTVKDEAGTTVAEVPPPKPPAAPPAVAPAAAADPDREAAKWVLSIGGRVSVNGEGQKITAAADLPAGRFTLTWVNLDQNPVVTDAGLGHFKDCKSLRVLNLKGTAVTDAGLTNFQGCAALTYLNLSGTQATDAGLANFQDSKGLIQLYLSGTQVTDAGLANFQGCASLTSLWLDETAVTDAGLAHFKDCKGLVHLNLSFTEVTDAGLASLQECKGLTNLNLMKTKVTAKGLAEFRAAVPGCRIIHDGGFIGPKK